MVLAPTAHDSQPFLYFAYSRKVADTFGSRAKYYRNGNWATSNCTDPAALFESLVVQPHDLIENITYGFYDKPTSGAVIVKPEFPNDVLSYIDRQSYGRCYVAKPTHEMIRNGIEWIRIYGKASISVNINSPGLLEDRRTSNLKVDIGSFKDYQINHEVHDLLEVNEKPCNDTFGYDKDYCEQELFEEKALKLFGCTTPFGTRKDKICKDVESGSKVITEMWKNFYSGGRYIGIYIPFQNC